MATNQEKLDGLYWQLCTDQGRDYLAELIGGRAAGKTLNTQVPRQGTMKGAGPVNLAQVIAWHDDGTLQILGKLADVSAGMGAGGASADEIKAALKDVLSTDVLTVDVKVNGKPEEVK